MNLKEVSSLRNKIDEVLSRSNSANLKSQRTISLPIEVSYSAPVHQQNIETNKTTSYPLYSSHINVSSPTYSYASPRIDVFRPANNYQVKTIHDLGSSASPLPAHYHVEEVRSAAYPSASYELHTVGYDRQKLDQIIARIQQNTPSNILTLEAAKTLSAPVETKKSARPQQAFRDIEADEESFIRDRKTKKSKAEDEEENQEDAEEPKEVEQESPVKRKSINKRQEVLSAKKQPQTSNNNEKEVSSPEPKNALKKEEATKGNASASAEDKKNQEKNELIMLAKKPSLRNSYFFGKEQRRGGSSLLQDIRFRE